MGEKEEISEVEIAIQFLEEALTGYSSKSKNELIKDAIKALKRAKK